MAGLVASYTEELAVTLHLIEATLDCGFRDTDNGSVSRIVEAVVLQNGLQEFLLYRVRSDFYRVRSGFYRVRVL